MSESQHAGNVKLFASGAKRLFARRAVQVTAGAAMVVAVGGAALAAQTGGSQPGRIAAAGNTIHACVFTKANRTIEQAFTASTPKCAKGSFSITINARGPQGKRGPAGPAGRSGVVATTTDDIGNASSVPTGGSFVTNSTEVGTMDLKAGTYLISANAKVTPDVAETVGVHPEFFLYNQAVNPAFAGDEFNFGGAALPENNTTIDTYDSGSTVITVPAQTTFHWVAFGYDDDRGASTYTLDDLSVTITQLNPAP